MKKLVAAVLTGVLVAGTLSTGVYAKDDDKTITVAASATPHAEILEEAKPLLEKEGYELEVTVFDDYVRPNEVVESGEFDANYFQHIPYLDQFNEEKGTHLVNAGGIHYEPFGIYPGTKDSLDDLEDGDTEEALRKCKVPVLFIHGEDDRLVPCEMSRRNYEACASEKMIFTVPEAGHTLSYMVDYEGYREAVSAFMKKIGCETDGETERSE